MDQAEYRVGTLAGEPVQCPDQHDFKLAAAGMRQEPGKFFLVAGPPGRFLLFVDADHFKATLLRPLLESQSLVLGILFAGTHPAIDYAPGHLPGVPPWGSCRAF